MYVSEEVEKELLCIHTDKHQLCNLLVLAGPLEDLLHEARDHTGSPDLQIAFTPLASRYPGPRPEI